MEEEALHGEESKGGEEEEEVEVEEEEGEGEEGEGSTMAEPKFLDSILPGENHDVDSIEAIDDGEDDPLEVFLQRHGVWEERAKMTMVHEGAAGESKLLRIGQRGTGGPAAARSAALELHIDPSGFGEPLLASSGFPEFQKLPVELGLPTMDTAHSNARRGTYADDDEQDFLTLQLATRTPGGIDRRVVHSDDRKAHTGAGNITVVLEDVFRDLPRVHGQDLGYARAETLSRHTDKCPCGNRRASGPRLESNARVWVDHVMSQPDTAAGSEGRGAAAGGGLTFSDVVTPMSEENSDLWKYSNCALRVVEEKPNDSPGKCTCGFSKTGRVVSDRDPVPKAGPQEQFARERNLFELNLFPEAEATTGVDVDDKISFGSAGDNGFSNGRVMRDVMNKSSSKVSVRTGTSLERQYSTGSTSTVESPALIVRERKERGRSRAASSAARASGNSPRLSFSFPGWRVDMGSGENCTSVVSHRSSEQVHEVSRGPPKRSRASSDASADTDARHSHLDLNVGEGSPMSELPDEILLQVMRRLEFRDLCSASQACKRWHDVGLQNELWEPFLGDVVRGLCSDASSDVLPRWVCKKSLSMSEGVRERFNVFSTGYDYLRQALHFWWDEGSCSSKYPSKRIHSLIRKLTENDWSLLYEALAITFTDRTDRIANDLERSLRPLLGGTCSKMCLAEDRLERTKMSPSLPGSRPEYDTNWKSHSLEDVSELDCEKGKKLWESLLKSWKRYKSWLQLVFTHCQDLNRCVAFERSRSPNLKIQTPTLFDKGLICFRSQVVLKYGLRNLLQAGFMLLTDEDIRDSATEHDVDLLRSCHHFLQELDVMDDCTLSERSHTQTKLRHCFPKALSINCKLALHMKDKWNQL